MVRTETPSCSAASLLVKSSRPDTVAGSNPAPEPVKKWHVLTSSDTNCGKPRDSSSSEVRCRLVPQRHHATCLTIPLDGVRMVTRWRVEGVDVAELEKTEKITINIGLVDLGQIDLLVNEGFYANRTDFIRTAIRRQLEMRSGAVDQTVTRRTLTLGTQHYSRQDLEELRATGQSVELRVLGLATIDQDVSPELALATITSVEVLGAFRAPRAVKEALAPRTV
jgi:Arc/MetJ-type ribon-helix-helix transcriptional regulator